MEIRGSKLHLRDWKDTDIPSFRDAYSSNTDWLRFDAPFERLPSVADLEALCRKKASFIDLPPHAIRTELVIADPVGDRAIGRVSRYWQSEETNWLSVGIAVFSASNWGGGIGRESLLLWGNYLFESLPALPRLDLRTWDGNQRMVALAASLGFKEEARFRKARVVEGQHHDALGFGILREEWVSRGHTAHKGTRVDSTASVPVHDSTIVIHHFVGHAR